MDAEDENRLIGMSAQTNWLMYLRQLGATHADLWIMMAGSWEAKHAVEVKLGIIPPDQPLWPEWPSKGG